MSTVGIPQRPKPALPTLNRGTRVLILGLGVHGGGVAAARYFARHHCTLTITDSKTAVELASSIRSLGGIRFRRRFGGHRISDVRWADLIYQNPGVPREHPLLRLARRLGKPIVNDAVLLLAEARSDVLGVTGTRGKSTTAALAAAMLGVKPAGLPGAPLLAAAGGRKTIVAEFSSWQCELLPLHRTAPDVAVITNLSPDHLNRYRSFSHYAQAKAGILKYQTPVHSFAVLSRDDARVRPFSSRVRGHRAWFSLTKFPDEDGTFLDTGWFCVRDAGRIVRIAPRAAFRLSGSHAAQNALAAIAAVWWIHPDKRKIRTALEKFQGLPGRQERVAVRRGVSYINDTTATSPVGAIAALEVFGPTHPVVIAGGVDKGLEFRDLARALDRLAGAVVLLPGSASKKIEALLRRVPIYHARDMPSAVQVAAPLAVRGSTVLLSPAAASFNLFRHEYDRGDQFVAAVRSLT